MVEMIRKRVDTYARPWRNELTTERIMLKNSAHQKPSTLNPGTILSVIMIIIALITRVNNPRVRILIGRVRVNRTGLINALTNPKTMATTRLEVKPLI